MSKDFYIDDNLDISCPDKGRTFYGNIIVKNWGYNAPKNFIDYYRSLTECKTMIGNVVFTDYNELMPNFNFEEIIGNFSLNCPGFRQRHLDSFHKVKKIKGNVKFTLNTNLRMDCIEEIEGDLVVSALLGTCATVSFERLKKISGHLIVESTARMTAPNIEEIGALEIGEKAHCVLSSKVKISAYENKNQSCEKKPSPQRVDAKVTHNQPHSPQMTEQELKSFISSEVEKMIKEKLEESNSNPHNKKSAYGLLHRLKKYIGLKSKEEEANFQQK